MIQVTNARRASSSTVSFRRDSCAGSVEGSEQWGSWYNDKHYSLEVIQNPIRARMCGFGDKDRRPLAPAAVAKMTVRREDNTIVDVDEIDVAFFVVTVDLWSADGKQEMNLVLHPSSADRYIPTHVSKPRRRGNGPGAASSAPDSQPSLQALPPPATAYAHAQHQSVYPGYPAQPPPGMPDPNTAPPYPNHPPYPHYPEHPAWGYTPYPPYQHPGYPGYPLPPIQSFHSTPAQAPWPSEPTRGEPPAPTDSEGHSYPAPSPAPPPPAPAYGTPYGPPPQPVDGGPLYAMQPYGPPPAHYPYAPPPPPAPLPPPTPVPAHHSQSQSQSQQTTSVATSGSASVSGPSSTSAHKSSSASASVNATPSSPSAPTVPLPRHTYTRTLVGPLSANAARLNDEHRKPGVFFLFQDLSIRTEGTFKLRLRLMNVGAHPAPEPGANRVMTTIAPILAQTFTESFTVYSAKRFPGVPDTTALSIAFGNQGQKLPLRNRHGSRQTGRRRRRDESDSEDDSDGR